VALLVAIEGIDGVGKGTQSALLCRSLGERGRRAALLSFPRYHETRFGAAAGEFLNGRFGALDEVHPQLAALLFAGDRFESRDVILEAATRHDVVVFDRYVASNVAHQAAKLDEPERSKLIEWIEAIEYDVFGLPRPGLTVLLDLPTTEAQRLIARKSQRSYTDRAVDLHEIDADYLERVRKVYQTLARQDSRWETIDCLAEGTLRPVESIAAQLQTIVARRLTNA
jgi:dTMP kinase